MKLFRWFAVVPSAILAWYAAFISGLFLHSAVGRFCPPEEMISGHCGAWWHVYAERTVILLSVAASAFLVVVCAAAVAPSHRVYVAWAALASGALAALYFLSQTSAVGEFVAAILAGLFGVSSVARYLGSSMLSGKLEGNQSFDCKAERSRRK